MSTLASQPEGSQYRGATVEDIDPPPALSCKPDDLVSQVLMCAFERDYTHLTVISPDNRALLGYVSIPRLRERLDNGSVAPDDAISKIMIRFQRREHAFRLITMTTPLEELEDFFTGNPALNHSPQEFAVITDEARKFVLGVATRADLDVYRQRRPVSMKP